MNITAQLQDVISRCSDDIASPFLIHRRPSRIDPKHRKNKIHWTEMSCELLTRAFKETRGIAKPYPKLSAAEQPSFHEIRALPSISINAMEKMRSILQDMRMKK